MKRLTKQCIVFVIGFIAFLIALGIIGKYDYAEEVVYSMPDNAYQLIKQKIGDVGNVAISEEYLNNREYYDSLK